MRWLQAIGNDVKPDTFIPRNIYGKYIETVLDEAEAKAPNYVHLERLNDEAIALRDSGHKGIIHVVSRHGLFPHPHKPATPYPAFLSPETAPKNIRALLRLVRQQLQQDSTSEVNWRAVIDSLSKRFNQVFGKLGNIIARRSNVQFN
ncbi:MULTISPECIES: FAD/NAD(P)-binding protein [Kamptonema]|uniref:FAD/NAD(P)-binding protein n=1 Tax=Kamptonema TaxID=1501433 RepID=UPI0001DACADA|nr:MULTISPECIES: FAD/NAD(P)-binding protein [Kamptonema]CBN56268.1 hypothetical protein OSCI_2940004 [Kamptonema sp. PCC 6506]